MSRRGIGGRRNKDRHAVLRGLLSDKVTGLLELLRHLRTKLAEHRVNLVTHLLQFISGLRCKRKHSVKVKVFGSTDSVLDGSLKKKHASRALVNYTDPGYFPF